MNGLPCRLFRFGRENQMELHGEFDTRAQGRKAMFYNQSHGWWCLYDKSSGKLLSASRRPEAIGAG
jgi:hypothetical protein